MVFLVITVLVTYVLAATISNASFGDTNSYKANFTDVTGLEQGDDVRIAGVRVGTVERHQDRAPGEQAAVAQVVVQRAEVAPAAG